MRLAESPAELEYMAHGKHREPMLERRRFALAFRESGRVRRDGYHDKIRDEYATQFVCDLFCKDAEHVSMLPEFSCPADWWQALKARWFPKWALKRWPVKNTKVGGGWVRIDTQALFPDLAPLGEHYKIILRYDEPRFGR